MVINLVIIITVMPEVIKQFVQFPEQYTHRCTKTVNTNANLQTCGTVIISETRSSCQECEGICIGLVISIKHTPSALLLDPQSMSACHPSPSLSGQ